MGVGTAGNRAGGTSSGKIDGTITSGGPDRPGDAEMRSEDVKVDRNSDRIETWTGEQATDYAEHAKLMDDGTVQWRNFLFDGWANVLGG
jgi:hypothetical protein